VSHSALVMSEFDGEALAEQLGLESWHVCDWGHDEYSRGSWSVPLLGFSPVHPKVLSTPLSNRFVLAGEHCSVNNSASVHGAAETGIKAARLMSMNLDSDLEEPHVVIVGGGASGISAAVEMRELHPKARITIVEARDRLMGRVNTIRLGPEGEGHPSVAFDEERGGEKEGDGSVRIDMGASWLHACSDDNMLYDYCRENNIPMHASDFQHPLGATEDGLSCEGTHMHAGLLMCECRKALRRVHRKRGGSLSSELEDVGDAYEGGNKDDEEDVLSVRERAISYVYDDACENMPVDMDIDMSVSEALRSYLTGSTPEERRLSAIALRGVIGIDSGYRFDKLSAHWLFEQPGPGYGDNFLERGFASIFEKKIDTINPTFMKADSLEEPSGTCANVWLSTPVQEIDWSASNDSSDDGKVVIKTAKGSLHADCCICTIPVMLLKEKAIKFTPDLPRGYQRALATMGMAFVGKIALRFKERWWPTQLGEDRNMLHWYGQACCFEDKRRLDGYHSDDVPHVRWVEWLDVTDSLGEPVLVGFIAGEEAKKLRGDGPVAKTDREVALDACQLLTTWAAAVNKMRREV